MIFVTHIRNAKAAKDYFSQHLSPGDYYGRDSQEMKGEWFGRGAELLGLSGEVLQENYFSLCDNIEPATGKQLTPENKSNRRVLTDFTFDAPKSVSLALEFGGHDGKGDPEILEAFKEAVQETLQEMEAQAMTRVRRGGADHDRNTANFIGALHIHRTARPVDGEADMQLHGHATVVNATYDPEEDRWKAIQLGDIVRDKGYYQAAFHTRLAGNLRALGYGIERDGNSFKLAGIDRPTVEKFSRRTAVIEEKAEALGIEDPKAKGELGRKTRQKKSKAPKSMTELRQEWASRLTDAERAAIAGANRGHETTTLTAKEGMDFALEHCFERNSVVPERELLKTALIQSVGNAPVEEISAQAGRGEIIRKRKDGRDYVTTRAVRQEEMLMSGFVREGRGRYNRLGNVVVDIRLSREQQAAMTKILSSRDAVTALEAAAGTGKTTTMKAVRNAIEKSRKKVFAFAPSAEASRGVQRSEGFENADTVEKLLTDEKLQRETKGQVVWIDEAGLLGSQDMLRVFELAKRQEFRIILSGDTGQHHAVRRGDAMRILRRDAGLRVAGLSEVRRQTNREYREAVTAISKGDQLAGDGRTQLEVGIGKLDAMGAISEIEGEERARQIAADYVAAISERRGKEFKTALVVAPTHAEGGKVSDEIRTELKAAGQIKGPEEKVLSLRATNMTAAQRSDFANYETGQVIRFNQNARGFVRGDKVTVTGIDRDRLKVKKADGTSGTVLFKDARRFDVFQQREIGLAAGDKVRITQNGFARERNGLIRRGSRLDNGSIYEVAGFEKNGDIRFTNGFVVDRNYGGLTHGYVVTSHASQGKTVDKVFIALGQESFAAANREQFYVSVSRAREAVKLYTDDKAEMLNAVRESGARMSASELLEEAPKRKPGVMRRLFDMQRVRRAYQAVRERMTWIPKQEVRGGQQY
jgi:conjugative relaxase-like TrwC/TraI family protein